MRSWQENLCTSKSYVIMHIGVGTDHGGQIARKIDCWATFGSVYMTSQRLRPSRTIQTVDSILTGRSQLGNEINY